MNKIELSKRSIASMFSEIGRFPDVETGGLLLGTREKNAIYIAEATIPGYKAVHSVGGVQCDMEYINYTVLHLESIYVQKIYIVGIWHKHNNNCNPPFSKEDMQLHETIQKYSNGTIISALFQKQVVDKDYLLRIFQIDSRCKITEAEFEIKDLQNKFSYKI